jgi:rod shape-determining protein MreD
MRYPQKTLVIIFLFYLFALLQNSFFTHFNLFGVTPNLVFILFFLIVFFEGENKNYQIIFFAVTAGFFLDIFSNTYLGPSIILLIIMGFLLKKTQSLLKNRDAAHPFIYFSPLFLVSFIIYEIVLMVSFDLRFVFAMVYNLFFAIVGFWIFKKVIAYVKV